MDATAPTFHLSKCDEIIALILNKLAAAAATSPGEWVDNPHVATMASVLTAVVGVRAALLQA